VLHLLPFVRGRRHVRRSLVETAAANDRLNVI